MAAFEKMNRNSVMRKPRQRSAARISAAYISFRTARSPKACGDDLGAPPLLAEQPLKQIGNRYVIGGRLVDGDSARDVGSSHRDRGARSTEGGQAVDVR
jgi:hypothetical protein